MRLRFEHVGDRKKGKWMKFDKKMFFSILLFLFLPTACSIQNAKIDNLLREPKGTESVSQAIDDVLTAIGLHEKANPQKIFTKIVNELKPQMPDDVAGVKAFIDLIPQEKSIIETQRNILSLCQSLLGDTGALNQNSVELVAYVIHLYLIYRVQNALTYIYLIKHKNISEDDSAYLFSSLMNMCMCQEAPFAKRLLLICSCIGYMKKHFLTEEQIVVTSFGSEDLLMEYLLIQAMRFAGYATITLNAIDQSYRKLANPRNKKHIVVDSFSKKLGMHYADCVQGKIVHAALNKINVFDSANDYIQLCKSNPHFKSKILLAVDPSMDGISSIYAKAFKGAEKTEYRFGINRVDIAVTNQAGYTFDVTIYLPQLGKPRIYWDRLLFANAAERKQIMESIDQVAKVLAPQRRQDNAAYHVAVVEEVFRLIASIILKDWQPLAEERARKELQGQQLTPEEFNKTRVR